MTNATFLTLLVYMVTSFVSAIPLDMDYYKIIEGDILELNEESVSCTFDCH